MRFSFLTALAVCLTFVTNLQAQQQVRVTVSSNAPVGGVALTPVWVGFHDGSFDSYNGGLSSQVGLERLAEDGNNSVLAADFANNLTYIDNSSGTAVSATVASTHRQLLLLQFSQAKPKVLSSILRPTDQTICFLTLQ